MMRLFGLTKEYPSSNPKTPNSLRDELQTLKSLELWSSNKWQSGVNLSPVF